MKRLLTWTVVRTPVVTIAIVEVQVLIVGIEVTYHEVAI